MTRRTAAFLSATGRMAATGRLAATGRPVTIRRLAGALAAAVLLAAPGANAQAPGTAFNGLKVSNDQPIAIESDKLDVDDAKAMATFVGNVTVAQGETLMKSAKMVVFYVKADAAANGAKPAKPAGGAVSGSSQIDRIEASGKVYIKSTDQIATSETANFDMKTQIAVLNGNVVLTQGENVVRGEKLTIHMDTGVAALGGGRVKMLMAPNSAPEAQ